MVQILSISNPGLKEVSLKASPCYTVFVFKLGRGGTSGRIGVF